MIAHHEKMMRDMLDNERDNRWVRVGRLRAQHADASSAPDDLRVAYLDADCALERSLKASSMAELYKVEHPGTPDLYSEPTK
jgi:hypothetical protein